MSTTPDLESMQKEINDLKRQNKLLKQKNSDKMMVQSKKSLDSIHQKKPSTELPSIAKPIGKPSTESPSIAKPIVNYVNIPVVLNLSKEIFNGYKFKTNNPKFPETAGDWAIKELFRRSINNKRAHQKRRQKKTEVFSKKNREVIAVTSGKTAKNLTNNKSDNDDNYESNCGSNSSISVEDNDREGNSTTEILSEVAISGNKSKNERKKSGRISSKPRKDYNENNKAS
ncbi:hypothetical protein RhiirC2_864589 [Rhizophagus irregularis]|uniref:Uncharacterized protein n=1 Tax=Rhizophagus irregularis TaxID=588596 RepID=A0A2N1NH36_9GLOM|nr:hypothetical protein RhiirC2_864589 [Rhizophagus irregularis]